MKKNEGTRPNLPDGTMVCVELQNGMQIIEPVGRLDWTKQGLLGDILAWELYSGSPVAAKPKQTTHLPEDAKARKALPIYSGFIRYFPDAMIAVAELSRIGNDQHNPGKALHWDRSKSGDELDALTRHLVDAGTMDNDNVRHSTKVAWRAMANLQKEIEAERGDHG